jgi:hypothetical protein
MHISISLLVLVIFTMAKIMSPRKPSFFIVCTESIRMYECRVYHQLLQYIAKLRQITIDLYKSGLVTIEIPRNHSSSQHQIVFAIVEKYIGIVANFLISQSFQITLKLHKNHDLNQFAPTHILLRRLCPQPPDPNTVGKAETILSLHI